MIRKTDCKACIAIEGGVKFRQCPKHTCDLKDLVHSDIKVTTPYLKSFSNRFRI